MNFEDIFDSDRQIILEKLKKKDEKLGIDFAGRVDKYQVGLYE